MASTGISVTAPCPEHWGDVRKLAWYSLAMFPKIQFSEKDSTWSMHPSPGGDLPRNKYALGRIAEFSVITRRVYCLFYLNHDFKTHHEDTGWCNEWGSRLRAIPWENKRKPAEDKIEKGNTDFFKKSFPHLCFALMWMLISLWNSDHLDTASNELFWILEILSVG